MNNYYYSISHLDTLYPIFYHTHIYFFFFNDTATTEIYTLSLHDALPILGHAPSRRHHSARLHEVESSHLPAGHRQARSEEHTSELQSRQYLVCRLLLEKKKKKKK